MEEDIFQLLAWHLTRHCHGHCNFDWESDKFWRCINWCTHPLKAVLTLKFRLFFCTAESINRTLSSFSAAAVSSTRLSQQLSFMCISAAEASVCDLGIWRLTHFLIAHILHHRQGDAGSALEIVSPQLETHRYHPGIYPGHRTHPFRRWIWTGRIWWTLRWRELESVALNSKYSHDCSRWRTILIGTDIFVKPEIERWSMAVHRDAVPEAI